MMAIQLIEIEGEIYCRLCEETHPEMVAWGSTGDRGCGCDVGDWDKIYRIPETTDG